MEKEALFKVDRKHEYKLKHPVLRRNYQRQFEQFKIDIRKKYPRLNFKQSATFSQVADSLINVVKQDAYTEDPYSYFETVMNDLFYPQSYEYYCKIHEMEAYNCRDYPKKASVIKALKNIVAAITIEVTQIKEFECTCKGDKELALAQLLPVAINNKPVICYNSCLRTLFAAFKRATMQVFPPEQETLQQFKAFAKNMIDRYLKPHLLNFDYSFSQWYNKMPLKKQQDIDRAMKEYQQKSPHDLVEFGLFCKREKQEEGGKNRAIANIDPVTKYIMGPVTWALEDVCDHYFPGYCGKKNWDDLETYYMNCEQDGFKYVLQGDGSAFDLSQHAEIKEAVDFYIYKLIADKVHHVDKEMFLKAATYPIRKLKATLMNGKRSIPLASALVYGTVFSGASDTTLMNTLRMSLYNHFTLQRLGYKYDQDYRLLSKGDDFIVFVKQPTLKGQEYEKAYYQIWSPKAKSPIKTDYKKHGIGQILKFLIVGSVTDIDFCSTCVIRGSDQQSLKIVRRPERMAMLDSYSRAVLKLKNKRQTKQYLLDQALALEISHGRLPFYRTFIDAYRAAANNLKVLPDSSGRDGKSKKTIPDDNHRKVLMNLEEVLFQNYGHDFQRTFLSRFSTHTVDDAAVYEFLLNKYNISKTDVEHHYDMMTKNNSIFNAVQQSIDEM
jgi:hypothetical protein